MSDEDLQVLVWSDRCEGWWTGRGYDRSVRRALRMTHSAAREMCDRLTGDAAVLAPEAIADVELPPAPPAPDYSDLPLALGFKLVDSPGTGTGQYANTALLVLEETGSGRVLVARLDGQITTAFSMAGPDERNEVAHLVAGRRSRYVDNRIKVELLCGPATPPAGAAATVVLSEHTDTGILVVPLAGEQRRRIALGGTAVAAVRTDDAAVRVAVSLA